MILKSIVKVKINNTTNRRVGVHPHIGVEQDVVAELPHQNHAVRRGLLQKLTDSNQRFQAFL